MGTRMDERDNSSNNKILDELAADTKMELYSIVLSTTVLFLAIFAGGGGCVTVIVAMFVHRMMRKLRFIIIAILLAFCCVLDFIWCPIEISCLILHHQNLVNGTMIHSDILNELKYIGNSLYLLLMCAIAVTIVFICVQNLLKIIRKYDSIPKLKLGIICLCVWLFISIVSTLLYILISYKDRDVHLYHTIRRSTFQFKIGIQTTWIILLLLPASMMAALHLRTKFWNAEMLHEVSDLHSNENFTVPSLIIKNEKEIDDDNEESSVALPSPYIQKDSISGSPVSKTSKSALRKRSGSPSSQKVLFADTTIPTKSEFSPKFGERFKSPNHLGVNMAAILGRRRHTIAQISDQNLDLMQKAKTYNYVRKFSVDISALQAQLENPKIHSNCPFHSQLDMKAEENNDLEKSLTDSQIRFKTRSRDQILQSQEISEEPEIELENEMKQIKDTKEMGEKVDKKETQSVYSQSQSVRSFRDSICPTPPRISLTLSDGEEKQLETTSMGNNYNDMYPSKKKTRNLHMPCKLSCLLIATFILSILPMFFTELLREYCLSHNAFINIVTCMTAISTVQTMIYPQLVFCVDDCINHAVHQSLMDTRTWLSEIFHLNHPVSTHEDISDTEA